MDSSTSSIVPPIRPTWIGSVESLEHIYQVIEACLSAELCHINRFPREDELPLLLQSGNMFVYADPPTGRGHWNDRISWTFVGHENTISVEREHSGPSAFWKKSRAIHFQGVVHHFVLYYKPADKTLKTPSDAANFPRVSLRPELALQLQGAGA